MTTLCVTMGRSKRKHKSRRTPSPSSSSSSSATPPRREADKSTRELVKRLKRELQELRQTVSTQSVANVDESVIPLFEPGKDNAQSVTNWVKKIDELKVYYKWTDTTTLKLATSRLRGNARGWYDSLPNPCLDWQEMKNLLIQNFPTPIRFGKLLFEAACYRPSAGQNLGDYCYEKAAKLNKLKLEIPEEYVIDSIIEGIQDDKISIPVRAATFQTVGNLANYLSTISYATSDSSLSFSTTSRRDEAKPSTSKGISMQYQNRPIKREKLSKNIRCFNCGENHLARDCIKRRLQCMLCKRLGHSAAQCQKKKNKQSINEITSGENKENMFNKTALINGHKIKCLLDSGSECSVMRISVARRIHLDVQNKNVTVLKCFMGYMVSSNLKVRVCLTIEEARVDVTLIILEDHLLKHDLIVGRDFMTNENVIMVKNKNKLSLRSLPPLNIDSLDIVEPGESKINADIINFGDRMLKSQQLMVVELLREYKDCISFHFNDLGKTTSVEMHIKCTTDEPIVYRPYRMSMHEKGILRSLINDLLQNNIIRESTSPYASPVLLVKKKTGDYRMCVDYRRLNAVTVKDKYPLPLIDEQIDKLGGDNLFYITLDLASGFYQVPMANDSIEKTAFITPESHFEFLRMPFGLSNSPSVFQRLINNVLGDLKNSVAFPYIDDIIIPCTSFEEGLSRLNSVLTKFREHKLTLKLSKCAFFKTTIEYLGREISKDGVRPGSSKIEAVLKMRDPRNVKEIRQFLGLSGYFRKFVRDYARLVEPLTRLTKKSTPWVWDVEQEEAVLKVKSLLTSRPILSIFDPSLETELHTDASSLGIGSILIQINSTGQRTVVAYFSKQTTLEQRKYHSYELETMAVVLSLRHFRVYLLGIEFKVLTDCNALKTTFSKKDLIPRVGRWWLEVQDFNFSIEYRPGTQMKHADALSRDLIRETPEILQIDITEADWLLAVQLQDDQISTVRNILFENVKTSETKQYFQNYELRKGMVFRKLEDGRSVWLVPRNVRWQICRLCHDEMGHFSLEKTLRKIRENYWFAGMQRFVRKYISSCLKCQYYKRKGGKPEGMLHPIEKVAVPFHTLHLDHVGPFVTSSRGKKFLLVIVDAFTKFLVIEPVKNTTTRYVTKTLLNFMYLFGAPIRVITDRGSAFTSNTFKTFCETYGIKHTLNAVATPRANGQCERYNRIVLESLATTAAGDDEHKWDLYVKQVQSALNCTYSKSIGVSPLEALAGYKPRHVAESCLLQEIEANLSRVDLDQLRTTIKGRISEDQKKQKERFDKLRASATKYQVGDLVMVPCAFSATGGSKKLLPKYKGPFKVRKVLFNDRYEVEDLREGSKKITTVVAVDRMKPWIVFEGDMS